VCGIPIATGQMHYLQQWISQPRTVPLRKVIFQIHLWSGIGVGLYVFLISVTGSILVYRNELFTAAAAGADMKRSVPLGFRAVSRLLELHDDLLGGEMGRKINGALALVVIVLVLTGIVVWWPGIKKWQGSLIVHRHVGWRRFTWELHSMIGFWTLGWVVLFGLSGAYLGNPQVFQDVADRIQPLTEANADSRIVDQITYWLAYLHFGRINGIGIPCRGPGLCDQTTKLIWALAGLVPAVLFLTGVLMWWNRVLRKKRAHVTTPASASMS